MFICYNYNVYIYVLSMGSVLSLVLYRFLKNNLNDFDARLSSNTIIMFKFGFCYIFGFGFSFGYSFIWVFFN